MNYAVCFNKCDLNKDLLYKFKRFNEFVQDDTSVTPGMSHAIGVRGNVLNRVGHQQDK